MKAVNVNDRRVLDIPDKFRARLYLIMHIDGCSIKWRDLFRDLYPRSKWVLIFETKKGKIAVPMPETMEYEYDFSVFKKGKEKT